MPGGGGEEKIRPSVCEGEAMVFPLDLLGWMILDSILHGESWTSLLISGRLATDEFGGVDTRL